MDNKAGCSDYATCNNTEGSYNCTCKPGFVGNGTICEGTHYKRNTRDTNFRLDFDECGNYTAQCSPNATCSNSFGSYGCACNSGYSGAGVVCDGLYISFLIPHMLTLAVDVDECAGHTDNCSEIATCTNLAGGFSCSCNTGYSGNGVVCSGT